MVKYLGLYFANDSKNSPGFEHLLEKAGRATFAVQGKIKKMGNIVPELMVMNEWMNEGIHLDLDTWTNGYTR